MLQETYFLLSLLNVAGNHLQWDGSFVSEMHWGDRPRWVCRPAGRRHACGSVLPLHSSSTCPNAWAGQMFPFSSLPCCNNGWSIQTPFWHVWLAVNCCILFVVQALLGITLSEKIRFTCFSFSEETQICFQVMTNTFPEQTAGCTAGEHRLYWAEGIVYYSRRITSLHTFCLYI